MNRKNVWAYILFVVSLFWVSGQVFAQSQITAALKGTIDQVLEIVSDKDLKKNPTLRREKLQQARPRLRKAWSFTSMQEA